MSNTPIPRAAPAMRSHQIIGRSAPIERLRVQLAALGRRACTALIQGESGTGKELAARMVHQLSARADGPFVPVDCTTLRDTLFESQLFGHVRGAFSGADRATLGFIRAADGGTLFLDEIGELPLACQAKLLRCIQEGQVVPLGTTTPISVNVRLVAATHRDLRAMVARGEFREDLFYRLNVAQLRLPPLRERRDDIPLLVEHALDMLGRVYEEPIRRTISAAAMDALVVHDWPGNVRELINAIEHAMVFSSRDDRIDLEDLRTEIRSKEIEPDRTPAEPIFPLTSFATAERGLIVAALRATRGNQNRAACLLEIERHRLHRRIVHYGLTDLTRNSN